MRAYVGILSLALASCVSVGTNYSEAAVTQLRPGMSQAEVIHLLGKPTTVVTTSDGLQQLGWVHSQGSMFGAKAKSLTLPFGPDGRLLQVPGGPAAAPGQPAIATTSEAHVGAFSTHVETRGTATISGSPMVPAPVVGSPPGAQQLGPDIWLYPAPTPSGKCIQAPRDYQGSGSATRPSVSTALPRCSS